ncbi:unnamed protein product [Pleuronectes platessa]|uniref:Uncharacterized protein n=1 Tax=Pleuronectes platessa TaxID=8262 RepID=A0A9N7Y5M7_PLEPL|nr:unnamed protein product [Pleuronectes platessa]
MSRRADNKGKILWRRGKKAGMGYLSILAGPNPFKFGNSLFTAKKGGTLRTSKQDIEEHLDGLPSDPSRHDPIAIPSDIPPIEQPNTKWMWALRNGKKSRAQCGGQEHHQPQALTVSRTGYTKMLLMF